MLHHVSLGGYGIGRYDIDITKAYGVGRRD
jgi:hypothetical protein